jgi:hypothetical protein
MSTSRPFAYNPGTGITGTSQIGDIAVGVDLTLPYSDNYGGVQWWAGVDEDLGYAICRPVVSGDQPNPLGIPCYVGFDQSTALTDQSFLDLANVVFPGNNFTTAAGAKSWMDANEYWTSYAGATGSTGGTGAYNLTITQVGPNVVWSGSGSLNLTALTIGATGDITPGFNANSAIWAVGPSGNYSPYGGASLTYPTTMAGGSGGGITTPNGSGDIVGALPGGASGRVILVPTGYTSGASLSSSVTYPGTTIAGLGLSGGTYIWSWGAGANASSLVMVIG